MGNKIEKQYEILQLKNSILSSENCSINNNQNYLQNNTKKKFSIKFKKEINLNHILIKSNKKAGIKDIKITLYFFDCQKEKISKIKILKNIPLDNLEYKIKINEKKISYEFFKIKFEILTLNKNYLKNSNKFYLFKKKIFFHELLENNNKIKKIKNKFFKVEKISNKSSKFENCLTKYNSYDPICKKLFFIIKFKKKKILRKIKIKSENKKAAIKNYKITFFNFDLKSEKIFDKKINGIFNYGIDKFYIDTLFNNFPIECFKLKFEILSNYGNFYIGINRIQFFEQKDIFFCIEEIKNKIILINNEIYFENLKLKGLQKNILDLQNKKKKLIFFENYKKTNKNLNFEILNLENDLDLLKKKENNVNKEFLITEKNKKEENKKKLLLENLNYFSLILNNFFDLEDFQNYSKKDFMKHPLIKNIIFNDLNKLFIIENFIKNRKKQNLNNSF